MRMSSAAQRVPSKVVAQDKQDIGPYARGGRFMGWTLRGQGDQTDPRQETKQSGFHRVAAPERISRTTLPHLRRLPREEQYRHSGEHCQRPQPTNGQLREDPAFPMLQRLKNAAQRCPLGPKMRIRLSRRRETAILRQDESPRVSCERIASHLRGVQHGFNSRTDKVQVQTQVVILVHIAERDTQIGNLMFQGLEPIQGTLSFNGRHPLD